MRVESDPRLFLTKKQLTTLVNALLFAERQELPLTAHVTVTWKSVPGFKGSSPDSWEQNHRRLIRALSSFMHKHGIEPAYVWTRERVVGRGAHTHLLIHIPQGRWRKLKPLLRKHLHEALSFTRSDAVKITGDAFRTKGMVNNRQRFGLLRYLAKPIDPEETIFTGAGSISLATFLGVIPQAHASLCCKRVGWSENIGKAAQKKESWRGIRDILRLSEKLHPL